MTFDAEDAKLKMTSSTGFVLSTKDSPTAATQYPTASVQRIVLVRPHIDMDQKGDAGIWLEAAWQAHVYDPVIENLRAVGTFTYDDGTGSGSYDYCGIAVKGVTGVSGAYYNIVENAYVTGEDTGTTYGYVGILLTTTDGATSQKANFTKILHPRIRYCARGILVKQANDVYIDSP